MAEKQRMVTVLSNTRGSFWNSSFTPLNCIKNYTIIKETRYPTNRHVINNPSHQDRLLLQPNPHGYTGFDSTKSFIGESTARSFVASLQLSTARSKFDVTGLGKPSPLHCWENNSLESSFAWEGPLHLHESCLCGPMIMRRKRQVSFSNGDLFSWESFGSATRAWTKRLGWLKGNHIPNSHWPFLFSHGEFSAPNHAWTPPSRVSELLPGWEKAQTVTKSELPRSKKHLKFPLRLFDLSLPFLHTPECTMFVFNRRSCRILHVCDVPEVRS